MYLRYINRRMRTVKGILHNFQDKAHVRHRKLLVLLLLTIIALCFTIAPLQSYALETTDNGLELNSPMAIIPEFDPLNVENERDYLYKIADIGEYNYPFIREFDIYENLIFSAAGSDGLLIYDIANPQEPKLIAQEKDFSMTINGFVPGYYGVCYSEGYVYA